MLINNYIGERLTVHCTSMNICSEIKYLLIKIKHKKNNSFIQYTS